MRCVDDTHVFLLGDNRLIERPMQANAARRAVLNALRTIVPSRGVFKVDHICIDLVIYDFYYRGTELRMLIITVDTLEVFDAFAFHEDVLHVLQSCSSLIKDAGRIRWRDWLRINPGFDFFYIKCQQLDAYQSLHRAICSSAKIFKYNDALLNWITDSTRSFFYSARVENIPLSWKPIPLSLAPKLYHTPQLQALTPAGECTHRARLNCSCACDEIQKDYDRAQTDSETMGLWDVPRVLAYLPSLVGWEVRQLLRPSLVDIGRVKLTELAGLFPRAGELETVQPRESMEPREPREPMEPPREEECRPVYNKLGQRLLCTEAGCIELASCYWVNCCQPLEPITCLVHAARRQSDAILRTMVLCPVHSGSGRIGHLI